MPIAGEHAGRPAEEVAAIARERRPRSRGRDSVAAALRFLAARDWPKPPRILIAGSLYLAGAVLEENGAAPR